MIKEIDLPIQTTKFWTDSTLVFQCIRNETHRFNVYVADEVPKIRQKMSVSELAMFKVKVTQQIYVVEE